MCSSQRPIGRQPCPVIYAVANPVRSLLDRKISEKHQQSCNLALKQKKVKNNVKNAEKNRRQIQKRMVWMQRRAGNPLKKNGCMVYTRTQHEEGRSLERIWHNASHEPLDAFPGSQLSRIYTQGITSTTPVLYVLYRRCPLHANRGVGKERSIKYWLMVKPEKEEPATGTALKTTGPVPMESPQ